MDFPNFKDLFAKPNLNIHLADQIEVGYNQSGPNLAISGSLTSSDKILFIEDIAIDLISKEDRSYRQFGWQQFRPHKFTVGNFQGIDLKMASKFFITPTAPFQYNIFFSDQEQYERVSPLLKKIKENWQMAIERNTSNLDRSFENFIKKKFITELWAEVKALSFWKKGAYFLTFIARTKNPAQKFELQRSFTITDENITALDKSSIQILAELCNQSKIQNISVTVNLD